MKKWMLLILLLFAVLAGGAVWTERTLSPLRAQTETAWEAADAAILRRAELVPALTAQTGRYTSESGCGSRRGGGTAADSGCVIAGSAHGGSR